MNISCKEELQLRLDLLSSKEAKKKLLAGAGRYASHLDGWFIVTDDGECHLINDRFEFDDVKKVKEIDEKMVKKDIKRIKIPNTVTSIGERAFEGCCSLTNMTIPGSVTNIEYDVFYGCNSLTSILFKGKTIEQVKSMKSYPWAIEDESIIHTELG